jgi:hypothetical protein
MGFRLAKSQLLSKQINEVIVSPKKRTKYCKDFCPEFVNKYLLQTKIVTTRRHACALLALKISNESSYYINFWSIFDTNGHSEEKSGSITYLKLDIE